jgi:hypothetical protein
MEPRRNAPEAFTGRKNMKQPFRFIIGAFTAVSCASAAAGPSFGVAPYHPAYQWDDVPAAKVPWNRITHLILGYMEPDTVNGKWTVTIHADWGRTRDNFFATAKSYVTAGHGAGKKVDFMLGGAGVYFCRLRTESGFTAVKRMVY